ncbi:MAG: glycosyltransferase family 2 protein [Thermoanaerobaculia bacterium]|nr:glycosyltransferase family 2 protein [Thermoanaerobaculia bacterium]
MAKPVTVSVVVPVGGTAPAWPRCAESLERLDPRPHELIVVFDGVDDAASDGRAVKGSASRRSGGSEAAPRRSASAPAGALVLELDERGGPARARNRGVDRATGDVLFFLDSDVEAPSDAISRVQEIFDGPDAPDAILGSYDDTPSDPHFVSQYRNLLHHYVHQTSHETASTFWSGCGAVRREAFLEVGGFHEAYADPSIEDIELGARLIRAGHRIRLIKTLQVKHLKRWTFLGMLRTDLFNRAIPWTEQMLLSGGLVNDLNVKTRDRISVVLAFLLTAALPFAIFSRPARCLTALLAASIAAVNAGLFRFFRRVRGYAFAAGTLPLYWIYLLICGLGFGIGTLRSVCKRGFRLTKAR